MSSGVATPLCVAALTGLVVSATLASVSGVKEGWDSGIYFIIGIPIMCVVIALLSYRSPRHAWRWTLVMAVGQSVAMLAAGNSLAVWPLMMLILVFVSLPQFVVGFIASKLGKRAMLRQNSGTATTSGP